MTKIHLAFILISFGLSNAFSQQYELGLGVGGGNYIGDVGKEYYFAPNKVIGSFFFKRTVNPWFSTRLDFKYFDIYADDIEAESLGRQARKLLSDGGILNFSAGIEYNFLPRNPFLPSKRSYKFIPYMYSGLGLGFYYGTLLKADSKLLEYNGASFNVPMVLGIKYQISPHLLFSIETGAYYYFTDNLDGTEFYYDDPRSNPVPSTNLNSNDWYTFTSFSLIYTFGNLSCYFNM